MHEAVEDGWLTSGRFNEAFESKLAQFMGTGHALTANSGSSANLLAVSAVAKRIVPGDEIVTVAAGFPTTINPILQNGLVPVFVDITLPTYNVDTLRLEESMTSKTGAIVLAHTLGNPFNLAQVKHIADKYEVWLIEDCCDALGSKFEGQNVGTFGQISTCSFYPAHHITTGEGGAVFTSRPELKQIIESIRDWGRDCWCEPGNNNTCGKRFDWQLGSLPYGYDHKYTYSNLGYNLKMTDMQAACGLAQIEKLPEFIATRKRNWAFLRKRLEGLQDFVILPEATHNSDPSWFGFAITIKRHGERAALQEYLSSHRIDTRLLFAGNIIKQPYMKGRKFRVHGDLLNTDRVMNDSLWLGVWPGLSEEMLEFVCQKLEAFFL
jgi:CDP-6-deoxy-D-xylo-4-hexulose-3-dehydrase